MKSDKQYYIISMRYENFHQIRDDGFSMIGFPKSSLMAKKLKIGDLLVLYIGSRKSQLAAILEVNSEMIWENDLRWDDFYPIRYKTKPIIVLNPNNYLDMRKIKNGLSFINPEIVKFGVYFMSGIKRISYEDYKYLHNLFLKAKGKA